MTRASLCLGNQTSIPSDPSPDVSRYLPAELLASVFILTARDSYTNKRYGYPTPTRPSWVNVSYVCRYWRDVALNCPTLWSYIPTTSQHWIQELLARSQMAPLKICAKTNTNDDFDPRQVLSVVEQMMNHPQRIQKLRLHINNSYVCQETYYQILSKIFSTRLPCLQYLEISSFSLPEGKSWLLCKENTPALRTLGLKHCWIPWHALGPSILTSLCLSCVGTFSAENTMAGFLAMVRRMPHLVQLSIDSTLPSARDFLSNGDLEATPIISLPHLSTLLIVWVPLSAVTAFVSCIDIPLKTKVQLQAGLENTSEYMSTLDDYVRLVSLLGQRIGQPDSLKFRSLTISSKQPILAFSTSEHAECYSPTSFLSDRWDEKALLKITFYSANVPMHELGYPILSNICHAIPLTNIQSVHFLGSMFNSGAWRDILASLSGVRHIRFSQDHMPDITSLLSIPSHLITRSWQDGHADRSQGEIFVPALEELELYRTTLGRVCGGSLDPWIADVQALYDAIATRTET